MKFIKNLLFTALAILTFSSVQASEKFEPTWESLQKFETPEWYSDAKLGIFLHWGPQTIPRMGGWYPRNMYNEEHKAYKSHLKNFGHPSEVGYKDIIAMWKAEKFAADNLVQVFKRAGAGFIVPVATHHDNFDHWNSVHHDWNSVKKGPRKDIVGLWRDATLKQGLRFGVSTHLARSYSWFQPSHGADTKGPFKGLAYDGSKPENQGLYHETHGDTYLFYPKNPSKAFVASWKNRHLDLIDNYQPDLLYWDGAVPFEEVGRDIVAHLYNENIKRNGNNEALLCYKPIRGTHGDFRDGIGVMDLERGTFLKAQKTTWQNDTSIGPWFWDGRARKDYRQVNEIVDMFVDLVSKNGVLLMNIPLKPDGKMDETTRAMLAKLTAWTTINGEAIFKTRPWIKYGEGPSIHQAKRAAHAVDTKVVEGVVFETKDIHVRDTKLDPLGSQDIRFTASKDASIIYAFVMDWPSDEDLLISSLSQENTGAIAAVELLGHGTVSWSQDSAGLKLKLPASAPSDYASAFKIKLK
ncbi:alpha-L-fucosidase [Lentisphaera profundi]|uniref:alpha-L-fucosidase n=1 Tax=Lentisphaera profundi TaxID=1658616 RepID=A0ABY7VSV8_9BACT|nr:alpha-L-fucosidase [Lentisphaera profundi]WDE95218.1 alpha-L-fucosidase [Lentisphaera profundi]